MRLLFFLPLEFESSSRAKIDNMMKKSSEETESITMMVGSSVIPVSETSSET